MAEQIPSGSLMQCPSHLTMQEWARRFNDEDIERFNEECFALGGRMMMIKGEHYKELLRISRKHNQ